MSLWFSRLSGSMAGQMLMVAIGWQMYDLTGSAWDLGLVGLFQFVPALLLSLVAGQMVDRFHRARIMAVALAVQCGAAIVLTLATSGHWASREILLGVSILLGAVRAFQMPAQQALVPQLVPVPMLPRAMAFSSAGLQAAVIGGPALGGMIFALGAAVVHGTAAVLFALGCLMMLGVRYEHTQPTREPISLRTLFAGVAFIWRRKVVLGAVSLDLFAVLLGGATALLPIFAKDILHVGALGLGLLRAAPAAGALVTSVVLTRWPIERHVGRKLLVSAALYGLCMAVFGLSTSFMLSLVVLALSGCADMVNVVVRQTLVQLETPDDMRGRVGAVNSVFIGASNQLGEFESGATAVLLGPAGAAIAGGVGTLLVAGFWLRLFKPLAQRDRLA
jgi:MFS family permease